MTAEGIIWDVDAKHQPAAFFFFFKHLSVIIYHTSTGRSAQAKTILMPTDRKQKRMFVGRQAEPSAVPQRRQHVFPKWSEQVQSGRHVFNSPFSLRRTPRLVTAESVMERAKVKESSKW